MKNVLRVKHDERVIEMDKTFAKNSAIVGSREYNMLQAARRDYPEYTVRRKEIRKNKNKESYKGLTYAYMEEYISLHDDEEGTIMKEYNEERLISGCHSVRYPAIKNWFLDKFPEVKQFGMAKASENEAPAQENAEAEAPAKLAEIMSIHAQEEKEMDIGA